MGQDDPNNPPADLLHPPSSSDEQEPPVAEKLRRFAFEPMANELQDPADHKHRQRHRPEAIDAERDNRQRHRHGDEWDADRMTRAVDRVLMAARVLPDQLIRAASAQHNALPIEY